MNPARGAAGRVDNPKAGSPNDVQGKTKIDEIKGVEKRGAKLEDHGFGVPALTEARVLDQGEIQIVDIRSAEGVSSEGSECALVGPSAGGPTIRLRISNRNVERVADLKDLPIRGYYGFWLGLAPDVSPLVLRDADPSMSTPLPGKRRKSKLALARQGFRTRVLRMGFLP
jgi:hypothetical protein